jgi:uncharacterized protein YdeI (YjbR/CyaY-like superfamily)
VDSSFIEQLIAQKKMTKAGLAAIAHVYKPEEDKHQEILFPPDIIRALKANREAWRNFQAFPESYKRIRVAFIESRKRHVRIYYQKSLRHFIDMTAKNKRFGFVKEMK